MNTNQVSSTQNFINKFSQLLKHWRQLRRISQLELAGLANVSARHLSFLESGRSKPSREMVKSLGIALDLPLEEQNVLHLAAGFVPPYNNNTNIAENDPYVRQALDFILLQNEPYPAIVIDGHWDICMRNEASKRLFAPFHQAYDIDQRITNNAMHTVFHPKGLRQFIVNWEEFAGELAQILHREIAQGHQLSAQLLNEITSYPGASSYWRPTGKGKSSSPVMTMQLQKDDLSLSFFSTFTTFAMPTDAALQQLKIECFYPANEETAEIARKLATL